MMQDHALICEFGAVFFPEYIPPPNHFTTGFTLMWDWGKVEPMTLMWTQAPPKIWIPKTPLIPNSDSIVDELSYM